jgi:hypothetical protein
MFFVAVEIFEYSLLMMGGRERTYSRLSRTTG